MSEARALVLSVLVLAVGLGVIAIARTIPNLKVEGDALLISLILLPVITYMVFSGRVKELKGPGGLGATFNDVVKSRVNPSLEPVTNDPGDLQTIVKGSVDALRQIKDDIDESKPSVMILSLDKSISYDRESLKSYFDVLSSIRNFKFVAFVDRLGKLMAYAPQWVVREHVSSDEVGDAFVQVVNSGDTDALFQYNGIVKPTASTSMTNADALEEMMKLNLEALVMRDKGGRLAGIVERDQILSRMLLALAKQA